MNARLPSSIRCALAQPLLQHTVSLPKQCIAKVLCSTLLVLTVTTSLQAAAVEQKVELTKIDARFRVVTVVDEQLLLHLKNGHERIIAFPEAVELLPTSSTLPDCDIVLDENVVGFYPTRTFKRLSLELIGSKTGTVYALGVRSSTDGLTQPLKIVR